MISFNSPEFFTLAFVVVMSLVALVFGRREKQPPSTYIVQLDTTPADGDADNVLTMEPLDGGRTLVRRTGLAIGAEESINLVITVQEEQCTIIEKKGLKRRRAVAEPVVGEAVLQCLRPGTRYRIRYESQLTSTWATFALDTANPHPSHVSLKF